MRGARDRVHTLLEAVMSVGRGLELPQVLHRIVEAAVVLVDAEYGALGVVGGHERLAQFLPVGMDQAQIEAIGRLPEGHGILGELIRHPEPLRLEEISEHPSSYGFPANHPPMHSFLGVPIRVREVVFGNLYLTQKRGAKEFDAEDEAVLSTLAVAAGVAIENARMYEQSRYRQQWLEANAEIVSALLSGAAERSVLEQIVDHASRILHADHAVLAVPDEDSGELAVAIVKDTRGAEHEAFPVAEVVRREGTFLGAAASAGVPVSTPDLASDPRSAHGPLASTGMGPAVAVPLNSSAGVRGVLALARLDRVAVFAEDEIEPLLTFAGQAAIAMELADRRGDAEQLAVLADRDRIARDLHDLAIQRLFATGMTLQSLVRFVERPEANERLLRAAEDLDETIKIIRSTIFGLRVHEAGPGLQGLRVRTARVIEEAVTALGFTPALRTEGLVDTDVPPVVADHAIAVLREALTNVARHSRASAADVSLVSDGGSLTVTVIDDGIGIAAEGGRRSGLRNLAERARQLSGDMAIGKPPGGGTRLMWWVPLRVTDEN
ncbi:GAF domain-containing sensor histidine kinase [Streptomyces sp. A7024]|uniref:GAF domain-containing sensor histidine kinase n=1 Tax=Streptomyces coryli TaxID=1128680 RepID=A0A6G4TTN6_9ACTN|nr:GAF domain-containing sensor histidine kinase [Streptomyces coryli]NGN62387.1 GAF domain-containing sensor histidine kinase [Streptomyces coryli]